VLTSIAIRPARERRRRVPCHNASRVPPDTSLTGTPPWGACYHEDRGDGALIVAPAATPAETFLDGVPVRQPPPTATLRLSQRTPNFLRQWTSWPAAIRSRSPGDSARFSAIGQIRSVNRSSRAAERDHLYLGERLRWRLVGVPLPIGQQELSLRDIAARLVITKGKKKGQRPSPATVLCMLREHDEKTAAVPANG
jgi:hypothetical protein